VNAVAPLHLTLAKMQLLYTSEPLVCEPVLALSETTVVSSKKPSKVQMTSNTKNEETD